LIAIAVTVIVISSCFLHKLISILFFHDRQQLHDSDLHTGGGNPFEIVRLAARQRRFAKVEGSCEHVIKLAASHAYMSWQFM
jgi:hypothetical protein